MRGGGHQAAAAKYFRAAELGVDVPHPLIRILSLVIMAAFMPAMPLPDLLILLGLVVLGYLRVAPVGLARLRMGLYRLRWLLLAIGILYMGFTPGEALHSALPGLSREGVLEGLRRMLVLTDLLALVYLLLALTPTPQLAAALVQMAKPLRPLGLDSERLGRRLALVLEGVGEAQERLDAVRQHRSLIDALASALLRLEQQAVEAGPGIEVPQLPAPAAWQWLIPLTLLVALWVLPR